MGLLINSTNTSPQPDSDTAFLDALQSMSSDSDFYYAGKSVLKSPDIYSAVSAISNTVASCPFVSNVSLITKMLNDPDTTGIRSGFDFWSSVLTNLLIHGNAFALISDNGHSLEFVQNNQMTVTTDTNTQQVHYYYSPNQQTTQEIAPSSILHFKINSLDGISGISPLYALRDEIDLQATGNKTLRDVFQSGIHGMIQVSKTDLSDSAKENLRNNFQKIASSGIGVSDDSIKFEQINVDEGLLKAISTINLATNKISAVFGLPSEFLGVESEHSSVTQSLKTLFLQGLTPYFEAIQSELNNKLSGYSITQDKSNILPSSFADKAKTLVSLIQNGLMTPYEARQTLNIDMPDDSKNEALNKFYGSLNFSQLDNLSENNYNKANDSSDNQSKESEESK